MTERCSNTNDLPTHIIYKRWGRHSDTNSDIKHSLFILGR